MHVRAYECASACVCVSHRHQAAIREDCTTQYSHCLTLLPTAYMFTLWACCAPYRPDLSALAGGNHLVLGTAGTGKQARMVPLSMLLSHAPSMQGLWAVHVTRTWWAESVSLACSCSPQNKMAAPHKSWKFWSTGARCWTNQFALWTCCAL